MTFRILFYSTKPYDEEWFGKAQKRWQQSAGLQTELVFTTERLSSTTTPLAKGFDAVCIFVNDACTKDVLQTLRKQCGVRLILLRCAGFNNVDLRAAAALQMPVMRVPRYSPHAVAEHAVALLMCTTRNLHRAHKRISQHDFRLAGLEGFDINRRTVGVVGTGAIGRIFAGILRGFGSPVIAYDPRPDTAWAAKAGVVYVPLPELFARADIISLHVPLTADNRHIINSSSIASMKRGTTIINTSRGGLIDTQAAVEGLVSGQLRALGIDVYEGEAPYFFDDHSGKPIPDALLARLIALPNVVMTGHQAFFTAEALTAISDTTLSNVAAFLQNSAFGSPNEVTGAPASDPRPHHHEKLLTAKL